MNPLVKKIGSIPIKIVNTVAGGNAIDKLKETPQSVTSSSCQPAFCRQ